MCIIKPFNLQLFLMYKIIAISLNHIQPLTQLHLQMLIHPPLLIQLPLKQRYPLTQLKRRQPQLLRMKHLCLTDHSTQLTILTAHLVHLFD